MEALRREKDVAGDQLTSRLGPCRGKRRLQLHDRGPLETDVRFPPLLFVQAIPEPVVRQSKSARVPSAAVDDDDAHMRSIGRVMHRIPPQLPQQRDLHARLAKGSRPRTLEML